MSRANEFRQLIEQGNDCVRQKKTQQALLYFNNAVLLMPENIEALHGCAKVLIHLKRPVEASVYSQRALQLNPTYNSLSLHGEVLYLVGEYSKALDCFEQIIANVPDNYHALSQRALCLTQINRHEEALQEYRRALAICGFKDDWVNYNYSLCLLAMENLIMGFKAFEYRWKGPLQAQNHRWVMPEVASRVTLQGRSILVHTEQGLGDCIQFFRYVPLLVSSGARVFIEMQAALIPLFNTWSSIVNFIATGSPLPSCDYCCPIMSLAALFKTEINTIPQAIPYVSPNTRSFEACQQKLGRSDRKKVGIAWRGSDLNVMNSQRSIPLSGLLAVYQSDIEWICLQKEVYLEEKITLDQYRVVYHGLELSSLVGTAALIACLDLIITVDTSIAHLAAAMGKKVWIVLPFNADWRWFLHREDSPWYSNVRLFRQIGLNDWSVPLARIKELLTSMSIEQQPVANELIYQAHLHAQKGALLQAKQLYQAILMNSPLHHGALHELGIIEFQQNNIANAIQFILQAVEIAPKITLYQRHLGELLRRVGQLDAAIAFLQTAVNIEPDYAENHYLLGLAYNNNNQLERSVEHYRIAISYNPNYGAAWNNLGSSLEHMGDKQQAKIAYAAAIRLNPNHIEAQNNLGAICSEEGQFKEARIHFEAAIKANPDFIEAHYNLSLLKTYTLDDPHLALIKAMKYKIESYPISVQIRYYFSLGKSLDDTQQYQKAFEAYAEGNRLYSLHHPWNKTALEQLVQHIPRMFPHSVFKPQKIKETRYPIFIVGMPRSGTTLIEQILATYRDIHGAGELSILDEVIQEACLMSDMPFDTWVMQLSQQDYTKLGEEYLSRVWTLAPDKKYIVDKMPGNSFYIGMIYRMLPTAKIIHAMRDPMDSCFSCFTHLFKDEMTFAYDLTDLGHYYRLYADTMQYWHSALPPRTVFDLSYEQLVADPEALTRQLVEYIGLDWSPDCLHFYKNKHKVHTASFVQVRKPIYKNAVQRWQHFTHELQPLLDIVAPYRKLEGMRT